MTLTASVQGFVGTGEVRYEIERFADGTWILNGEHQPDVEGLIDIDLGFTPATNLLPLRRLDLAVGEDTSTLAAHLAFPDLRLARLEQSYRRLNETRYAYQAPKYEYADTLEVSATGFVLDYPKLWKAASLAP